MTCYLIYHPKREVAKVSSLTIYHDKFGGNEDPYIWNKQFLHTYCHITQLPNEEGQINFWISGDTFPNFTALYCDCVFVVAVAGKHFWKDANTMRRKDPLVENDQTYEHHYKWGDEKYGHHQLKRRRRYTLKADERLSFQPQDGSGGLIDILPFLNGQGVSTHKLRNSMNTGRGSRPFEIGETLGQKLYDYLVRESKVKLTGTMLANKHPNWKKGLTAKDDGCC